MLRRTTLVVAMLMAVSPGRADPLVPQTIPNNLGVNIHFTDAKPGELKMLAAAGFKVVRMDFDWAAIEKKKGEYDFAAYDRLIKSLDDDGLRALFILDYANPLYDDNQSPHTDDGRKAFARFAVASVEHFKGRKILWEMYNEPNIAPFWRPRPNTDDYVKLALEVGRALKQAAPDEIYIGPACSGVDLPFLSACFKAGLLELWDAVSVHPYRQQNPETVEDDYRALRLLIAKYAPKDKSIPIISGEWGYSSAWEGIDEDRQGKLLARQFLTNLANDVQLSVWYDWHDDGPDAKEPEHHFGTVAFPALPPGEGRGEWLPFSTKPAYAAAHTLSTTLAGFTFNKRLALERSGDYALLFTNGDRLVLVVWTTAREPHQAIIPCSPGGFGGFYWDGHYCPTFAAGDKGLEFKLTDAPWYLIPDAKNPLLDLAAAWERVPLDFTVERREGGRLVLQLQLTNPLDVDVPVLGAQRVVIPPSRSYGVTFNMPLTIKLDEELSDQRFVRGQVACEIEKLGKLSQPVVVVLQDVMRINVLPRIGGVLPVRIVNERHESFTGTLRLNCPPLPAGSVSNISIDEDQVEQFTLHNAPPGTAEYRVAGDLFDDQGRVIYRIASRRWHPLQVQPDQLMITADGDPKVTPVQSFEVLRDAPDGLPAAGASAVKIEYHFDAGWKYACLSPVADRQAIGGEPTYLCMWIKGDGSGNLSRMRFVDSTGQTFQPDGPKLDFTGWRYVEFPLDGRTCGHWGGAKDGEVHYPIKLDTLLLIDNASRQQTSGVVHIATPTLVYRE